MIRLQLEVYKTGTACLPECILAVYRVATIFGGRREYKDFSRTFNYLFHTYSSDVLSC